MEDKDKFDLYYNPDNNLLQALTLHLTSNVFSLKLIKGLIRRYLRRSLVYRKLFGLDLKKTRGQLSVFVIRNNGLELDLLPFIIRILKKCGFILLHEEIIPKNKMHSVSRKLRGGNWLNENDNLNATGMPEAILICFDNKPLKLSKKM